MYMPDYNAIKFDECSEDVLKEWTVGVKYKRCEGKFIADAPFAFDIETTSTYDGDRKLAFMYIWQLGINGHVVYGRTWDEFGATIMMLRRAMCLNDRKRIYIYVHNLSFEFQFIRMLPYFRMQWGHVLARSPRDPIEAELDGNYGITFRCSYALSNSTLEYVANHLTKYKARKRTGDLDYRLVRHEDTPLTDDELGYCISDVIVLMNYIQERIEECRGIVNIPRTQTGFVREFTRSVCFKDGNKDAYLTEIADLTLSPESYLCVKRGFMGGFCHANAWHVGRVVRDVLGADIRSSYPSQMIKYMPMSAAYHIPHELSMAEFDEYRDKYCCLFDIEFKILRPRVSFEHPISMSKCWDVVGAVTDNGRVVSARSLKTTITELDYDTYLKYYEWDSISLGEFFVFRRGFLPSQIIEAMKKLYTRKQNLKGVPGEEQSYMRSKEMLNSIYGMMVTDIARPSFVYDADEWSVEFNDLDKSIEHENESKKRVLYYPWGVWITAHARHVLLDHIFKIGDDYIYSDTDSIKFVNGDKHIHVFDEYNEYMRQLWGDDMDGIGTFEFDSDYTRFKTLGAKRYLYETKDGDVVLTVAGVGKKLGSEYFANMADPFEAFEFDMIIPAEHTGKLTHTYIDEAREGYVVDYLGNTGYYEAPTSIHLEPTEYNFNISVAFNQWLNHIAHGGRL